LKEEYPDRILIASIMEEYDKAAWQELIERVEETGVVHYASSIFFLRKKKSRVCYKNYIRSRHGRISE
jgi:L-rhamnose mutarotase